MLAETMAQLNTEGRYGTNKGGKGCTKMTENNLGLNLRKPSCNEILKPPELTSYRQ